METMLGCESPAAFLASRRKRSTNCSSCAWRSSRILIATRRPSSWSSARYTFAIPPVPSLRTTLYRPSKTWSMRVSGAGILWYRLGTAPEQRFHDLLRNRCGRVAADAVLVLEEDGHRDPRRVGWSEGD